MSILHEIFEKQKELQEKVGIGFESIQSIKDMTLSAVIELSESMQELNWKPWSEKARKAIENDNLFKDQKKYQEELVDVWHFLVYLTIASGMSADDLYKAYCHKNDINHVRQETGY